MKAFGQIIVKSILIIVMIIASFIIIISIIEIILLLLRLLFFEKYNLIGSNILGDYGDFISGIFSFITFILLLATLKEQKNSSQESFTNNLFFELLKYLQQEIADLNLYIDNYNKHKNDKNSKENTEEKRIKKYTNRDYFSALSKELYDKYDPPKDASYENNIKNSQVEYEKLFMNHPRLATYFRMLYRIYDLINNANTQEEKKETT